MNRTQLAAALILFSLPVHAETQTPADCKPLQKTLTHLRSDLGFKVYKLTDQQKDYVLLFERQHQGPRITDALAGLRPNTWYGAYLLPTEPGDFLIADETDQCIAFSHELNGSIVYHVLQGNW
jgi:hypothetical protein